MSEAYRGLTIRIGADTSSLTKALRSSREAIGYVNDEMVQLRKALRLDPANLVAANLKMRALGEASENTSSKLAVLLEQQRQMKADGIGKIAEGMHNVSENAGSAKARYNSLTEAIKRAKDQIKELSDAHGIAFNNKAPLENEKLLLQACGDQAKVLIGHYKSLVALWKEAGKSLDNAKQIQGFVELQAHIEKTKAEFKDYVRQFTSMRMNEAVVKAIGDKFEKLTNEVNMSSNALQALSAHGSALKAAFDIDPTNVKLLGMYIENCNEKAEVLKERIRQNNAILESMPFDAVARAGSKSFEKLALQAERSKDAANEAAAAADIERGKWVEAKAVLDKMVASHERNSTELVKQKQLADSLYASYTKLEEKAQAAFKTAAADNMATEVRKLSVAIATDTAEVEKWTAAAKNAEETSITATLEKIREKFGLTGNEAEEAASHVKEFAEKATSVESVQKDVRSLGEEFGVVIDRIKFLESAENSLKENTKSLKKALEFDPSNEKLMAEYMGVFADRTQIAKDKSKALDEILSLIKDKVKDVGEGKSMAELVIGLENARAEALKTGSAWEKATEAVDEAVAALNQAKTSGAASAERIEELESKVTECRERAKELGNEFAIASRKATEAAAVTYFRQLGIEIKADEARVKAFGDATENAAHKAKSLFTGLTGLGSALSYSVAPALQMAGMYMVNWADEVDASYRNMRKTVTGTEEQFERMRQAALKFSETHITSASTILEIEALGGQLGIATNKLDMFAKTVSNIEIATNIDAETAATDLGQLSNILDDLTTDTMPNFSDSLVRLGNNNAALESNIINVTTRIGSMGSLIGMTTPEILAWSTAIAATGQKSEAAGTAVSKTLSNIESAVSSGGEKVQRFAEIANMSADEFVRAWKTSPSMALQSFINGLAKLDSSGKSVDSALQSLGINATRQKQALMGLAQETDVLRQALLDSQYAWDGYGRQVEGVGDAQYEADQKGKGFSGSLEKLKNTAQVTGAMFGDALIGPIQVLNKSLELVNNTLSVMPDCVKTVLAAGLGLAAFSTSAIRVIAALEDNNVKLTERLQSRADATRRAMEAGKGDASQLSSISAKMKATAKETMSAIASKLKLASASNDSTKAATNEAKAMIICSDGAKRYVDVSNGTVIAKKADAEASGVSAAANMADAAAKDINARSSMLLTAKLGMLNLAVRALNFATLAGAVATVAGMFVAAGGAVGALADSETEFSKQHKELMSDIENTSADADKQASAIEGLAAKYAELSSSEEADIANKAKMQSVAKALASTSEELASALNDEANAGSVSADVITGLAQAEADRVRSQAAFENFNKLLDEQVSLEKALASTSEGTNEWVGELGMTFNGVGAAATDMANALEKNKQKQAELIDQMVEDQKTAAACARAFKNLGGASEATEDQLRSYGITVEQYAAYAQKELAQKTIAASEAFEELIDKFPSFENALKRSNVTQDAFKAKLDDAGMSVDDFSSAVDSAVSSVTDAFNKLELNQENTLEAFVSNTRNNQKVTEEWADNLKWLYNQTAIDVDKKFFKFLQSKGPVEYGTMLSQLREVQESGGQALVDGTMMTAQEIVDLWSSGTDKAVNGIVQSFLNGTPLVIASLAQLTGLSEQQLIDFAASTGVQGDAALTNWASSLGNALKASQEAGVSVDAAKAVFSGFGIDIETVGTDAIQRFCESIAAGKGDASGASSEVSEGAKQPLESTDAEFKEYADKAASEFVNTIESYSGKANSAAKSIADSAVDGLRNAGVESYWEGANFAHGFANGIAAYAYEAVAEASNMASGAVNTVADIIKQGSPSRVMFDSGKFFGQGFGLGIGSETKYVSDKASDMAKSAIDAVNSFDARRLARSASEFADTVASGASSGGYGVSNVTNYYIGDFNVNGTRDQSFAEELVDLLDKYGRLAAI